MQKLPAAPAAGVKYSVTLGRALLRVLAFPLFLVMSVGAMLLILMRVYRS